MRIRTATLEIQKVQDFDYLVINDSFDEALNELQSIITVEFCKRRHHIPTWTERWAKEIEAQKKVKGERSKVKADLRRLAQRRLIGCRFNTCNHPFHLSTFDLSPWGVVWK